MPFYKKILVLSDNIYLLQHFFDLVQKKFLLETCKWEIACSPQNRVLQDNKNLHLPSPISPLDVKTTTLNQYDLIFSIHCKQLFPPALVNNVKCINVHPGFNPYNRGWYPQAFSIINKKQIGATIHEIDEHLDHGPIIAQQEVTIQAWETSLDVYNKVLQAEIDLLDKFIIKIVNNDYQTFLPKEEGNLNLQKDFKELCKLDLHQKGSFEEFINILRATTHGDYKNAWYIDPISGKKIYLTVNMQVEPSP